MADAHTRAVNPAGRPRLASFRSTARALLPVLARAGLIAFVLGCLLGLREWSPAWPGLSALKALRTGALGWALGIVVAVALGGRLAAPLRARFSPRPGRGRVLTALGLLPGLLWVLGAVPLDVTRRASAVGRSPGDDRPNLVLITLDAMRRDHLGAYGDPRGLTPNLDAFAKDATLYDSAYAASSWTLASLGALATGLSPSDSGLMALQAADRRQIPFYTRLPEDRSLLAEQLRRAGYATAADVTNVWLERDRGWTRGFDYFRNEGGVDGDRAAYAYAQTVSEHSSDWLGLNWHRPFFLWMHYLDPHCPYDSPDTPKELRARYPSRWVARRDRWRASIATAPVKKRRLYQQFCREMYAEEVRYVDRWVGALLAELKAAGLYDTSLIVITADHGEELFDHGSIDHGHSMHEEVLAVPLLVKWPAGARAGKCITQVVPATRVAATLLESAQAPPLDGLTGGLPKQEGDAGSEVYSEGTLYGPEQTALTTDEYRVIYHPHGSRRGFEVYDRRRDRGERHDLADTGVATSLRLRLKRLTEAAETQARGNGRDERRLLRLSEPEKRGLRALGYLGK